MTTALVLNELSYDGWTADEHETSTAIRGFAEVLLGVLKESGQLYLLANERMSELVFGGGVPLRRFAGLPSTREATLAIMAFASKSPLSAEAIDVDDCEATYGGRSAVGMLYCCLMDGVLISFPTHAEWQEHALTIELSRAVDNCGSADISTEVRQVANLGCIANVTANRELLQPAPRVWVDGNELWDSRGSFAGIAFLDRVEEQLRGLPHGSEELRQVGDRLRELNEAVAEWGIAPAPVWKSYVTGEGETRKRLATFPDSAGVDQCYHLHARFTPGAGRIHFRIVAESRSIEIAHVGEKL